MTPKQRDCHALRARNDNEKTFIAFTIVNLDKMKRTAMLFLLSVLIGYAAVFSSTEVIDRIVAVVNEEVITLTDLRIAEAFGIYDEELKGKEGNTRSHILEKLIDQKLVIQLSGEEISMTDEELEEILKKMTEKFGVSEVGRKLAEFGLAWDDLKECVQEKMVYQTIITQKFSKVNPVSVKEIEDYYQRTYVPAQKEKGAEPKPMMEILGELESSIKKEKIKTQVEDWIANLKEKSDIQIMRDGIRSSA
jgi:hypothetical protein